MTESVDLRERLNAALESLDPSEELTARVSARVGQRERRRRSVRVAGTTLTLAMVVAGTLALVTGRGDDGQVLAGDPSAPLRWEVLPQPPVPARSGPTGVWTGTEVVFWGGSSETNLRAGVRADGAAFNPRTGSWRALPEAPIGARRGHEAVWTGREMIVWGGLRPDGQEPSGYADGAAYDPVAGTWRVLADSLLGPRVAAAAVWTGREVVVVGGIPAGPGADGIGASYDPATDQWRLLAEPDGLTGHTAAWAAWIGDEILYWRANDGLTGAPALFSYRPEGDRWTRRSSPIDFELAWSDAAVVWTGRELVITSGTAAGTQGWWGDAEAIVYDPKRDLWKRTTLVPNLDNSLVQPVQPGAVWTGREVVAVGASGSSASALDPASASWNPLPAPPSGLGWATVVVANDGDVYAWGNNAFARLTRSPSR
jgi:hypothetical protein